MYRSTIEKEEVFKLPKCEFRGEIIVIDSLSRWESWKKEIFSHDVFGLDTETKPSFKKGRRNKVALIQLATDERVFLIRTNRLGGFEVMLPLFTNPKWLKIGVGLRDDIRELKQLHPFQEEGFLELQQYVRSFGINEASLLKITAIVMGCRISKSQQLSNWEAPVLTEKQMRYAATDAWAPLAVYRELKYFTVNHGD